jgi:hypothetical protein
VARPFRRSISHSWRAFMFAVAKLVRNPHWRYGMVIRNDICGGEFPLKARFETRDDCRACDVALP